MKIEETANSATPRALQDVWAWKEAVWRDVAHLPTKEAVREILVRARRTAEELDLHMDSGDGSSPVRAVAEARQPYGKDEESVTFHGEEIQQ
jgi:hypothetical protein